MNISIGADPELFLTKNGKFRCAHNMIPGTKAEPFPVKDGAVQIDGFALEFNIDPVTNADDFVTKINSVMGQMKTMIPADHDFAIVPSAKFNGNHFRMQPDEAKELGCEPDYSAYTLGENPKPDNTSTMRTASGHIHIGFLDKDNFVADPHSEEHMLRCATLVKQLDCYLGLPSLLFDKDTLRRKMYGQAGAFRPKPYGVEYRVLSNAWLLSEERMRFVFEQTVKAVKDLVQGIRPINMVGEGVVQATLAGSNAYNAGYYIDNYVIGGRDLSNKARALAVGY